MASSTLATAMTTALPSLVEYFHVSTSTGQWITSGYSLVMGMVLPLTAFLITKFPTKWLYTAGIACFIAGLAFSIFAGSFFFDDDRESAPGVRQRSADVIGAGDNLKRLSIG